MIDGRLEFNQDIKIHLISRSKGDTPDKVRFALFFRRGNKGRLFQNSVSFERAILDVHAVFLLFYTMYIIILLM